MMRIIQRIDQGGDEEIDIVPLQNASAGRDRPRRQCAVPAARAAG